MMQAGDGVRLKGFKTGPYDVMAGQNTGSVKWDIIWWAIVVPFVFLLTVLIFLNKHTPRSCQYENDCYYFILKGVANITSTILKWSWIATQSNRVNNKVFFYFLHLLLKFIWNDQNIVSIFFFMSSFYRLFSILKYSYKVVSPNEFAWLYRRFVELVSEENGIGGLSLELFKNNQFILYLSPRTTL